MTGQRLVIDCETGEETLVDLTPEEEAAQAALETDSLNGQRASGLETEEDAERLALVHERAAADPAFAALAELALKGVRR